MTINVYASNNRRWNDGVWVDTRRDLPVRGSAAPVSEGAEVGTHCAVGATEACARLLLTAASARGPGAALLNTSWSGRAALGIVRTDCD